MNKLTDQFIEFFQALYGYRPFPWQTMLLDRVASEGWPDLIDLPTASGKTACIDVAVFALAMKVVTPRRIWFVVDRRIVVDEAYERASRIAVALRFAAGDKATRKEMEDSDLSAMLQAVADPTTPILREIGERLRAMGGSVQTPLTVGRLRGGVPRDIAWAGNPAQPAVLTSTIDQLGSRLLFRGYGIGAHAQSIHAALAGNDSLIVLDEAHLADPFRQTVAAIDRYRKPPWTPEPVRAPFKLVVMSATLAEGMDDPLRFPADGERAAALDHGLLRNRMAVAKPTELAVAAKPKPGKGKGEPEIISADDDELVMDAARRAIGFALSGRRRIAVMVNRVKTARRIFEQLRAMKTDAEIELLTGRLRPLDRDELIKRLSPALKSGSTLKPDRPTILCTTQCLEVGADFSFDALITECASLDALRQRFGRLSRLGEFPDASGVILIRKAEIRADEDLDDDKPLDPIYDNAAARTWNWLTADGVTSVSMGIDAIEPKVRALNDQRAMKKLVAQPRVAPILLPAYIDMWAQTSLPRPAIEPDISLFLHGIPPVDERPQVEVRVLWRDEIAKGMRLSGANLEEIAAAMPPLTAEMMQLPLRELKAVLIGSPRDIEVDADIEGINEPQEKVDQSRKLAQSPFIIWRSGDVVESGRDVNLIRNGDVIVLPADSPTFTDLLPNASCPPDVYEEAYRRQHGVIRRRHYSTADADSPPGEFDEAEVIANLTSQIPEDQRFLFKKPVVISYSHDFYHITGRQQEKPLDLWESDRDEDESLYDGSALSLAKHTEDVAEAADLITRLLGVSFFNATIRRAAELHDIGKCDRRFQFILNHGKRATGKVLAKSAYRLAPRQERLLCDLSGIPPKFRHELLSMQMADRLSQIGTDTDLRDLLLHLIGSHHGQCRPFARVVEDSDPPPADCSLDYCKIAISPAERNEIPPHRLDSGVAERFWRLTRRFGWWGLAYLEAIVRCADMHASAFRERSNSHG